MTHNDFIHLFKEACAGKCNAKYNPCIFRQAADALAELKPEQEPAAWGMLGRDGQIIDCITPADHDSLESGYTIPLYRRP